MESTCKVDSKSVISYKDLIKLHSAITIKMLHHVVTFENITLCCSVVLL